MKRFMWILANESYYDKNNEEKKRWELLKATCLF
jgi:hypothetical protein